MTLPITLEEAAKEIDFLLETATTTRDMQFASHLVLLNLLTHLDRRGAIDGVEFTSGLRSQCYLIEAQNERLAAEVVLDECLTALSASRHGQAYTLH